jgi:uncharacterized protein (TIGR00369 family)
LQLDFYTTSDNQVEVHYTVPDHFQGYPGVVHGGILAAMLDETGGRVFMHSREAPRFMYTAKMTIRYRKPVPTQTPLRLVGTALHNRERAAEARAEVFNPQGELLAEAELVLVDLPPEAFQNVDLEALGWKVYPDEEETQD